MRLRTRNAARPDAGGWLAYPGPAGAFRPWLVEEGSLTARLIASCPVDAPFRLRRLAEGDARPLADQRQVLGMAANCHLRHRDVLLCSGERPLVYARTVVARADLRHPWRLMRAVGGRSLGSVLFANPRIRRGELHYRRLDARHPLYHRALPWCAPQSPRYLWARRAAFRLDGRPLLVTEVFLPALLDLNR